MTYWLWKVRPTSQMRERPVERLIVWKRTHSCASEGGEKSESQSEPRGRDHEICVSAWGLGTSIYIVTATTSRCDESRSTD